MKTAVFVCEFNPLHKGHTVMLSEAKKLGFDSFVGIMSGSFVQRGECAVFDKYARAEAAVRCGFDLILELPFPYSCASSEKFASAAVSLAEATGIADGLVFGSECGDIRKLTDAAELLNSSVFKNAYEAARVKKENENVSPASLKKTVFEKEFGSFYPERPNDILGTEYIKALIARKSGIAPFTYIRKAGFSASAARKETENGDFSSVPEGAETVFRSSERHCLKNAERAIIKTLRTEDPETLSQYEELTRDLASRLVSAAERATDLETLIKLAGSKSYSNARIKRAVLFALCGQKKTESTDVAFSNVLAIGKNGKELLKKAKKNGKAILLTKPADYKKLTGGLLCLAKSVIRADEIYALTGETVREKGYYLKKTPFVLE